MPRSDFVSIEVAGQQLDVWTSYSVDSDLFTPADGFDLQIEVGAGQSQVSQRRFDEIREILATPGQSVTLHVGDDITSVAARRRYLQLTGIIDDLTVDSSRERGTVLHVNGRDRGALLTDSSVPVGLLGEAGTVFLDVVRAAVAPWSMEVVSDASASRDILTGRGTLTPEDRLRIEEARAQGVPVEGFTRALRRRAERRGQPLDEAMGVMADDRARHRSSNGMVSSDVQRLTQRRAQPRAGETVWEFLSRHAERLGLMLWMSPRGELVVSAPRYDQRPLYQLVRRWVSRSDDPNTILAGARKRDGSARFGEVLVLGRARGDDASRSAFRASVRDDAFPFERRLVVHDNSIRSVEEAERRARREVRQRLAQSDVLTLELPDHGLGRYLYAIDTIAGVDDEVTGASGLWYVTQRTFRRSRQDGTTTSLRLVPSGAIEL